MKDIWEELSAFYGIVNEIFAIMWFGVFRIPNYLMGSQKFEPPSIYEH